MLNTQKLLYILPDLAYLVELLPAKKAHTFVVQTFKQFNGELLKDGKLIAENIERLIRKLDDDQYGVILPDDLFTNTIINVERSSEKEVKAYLKEEVIPSLHITNESHQIETFILSEYKGVYKVQLSTVQKSVLAPLKAAIVGKQVMIEKIYPLSWVVKSLISLEPSIAFLQMGNHLFMAKHYIGVDQPMMDLIDNLDRFVEAIKTIKGVEPNLQTAYLFTDDEIEEKLKDKLKGVVPVQQLAESSDSNSKIPGHIEKIVTSTMRTVSIPDFEIPQFGLKDVNAKETVLSSVNLDDGEGLKEVFTDEDLDEEKSELELPDDSVNLLDEEEESELPKPSIVDSVAVNSNIDESPPVSDDKLEFEFSELSDVDKPQEMQKEKNEFEEKKAEVEEASVAEEKMVINNNTNEAEMDDSIDLKKFVSSAVITSQPAEEKKKPLIINDHREVLKNNDGTGSFFKVFLIGLVSFIVTVAVGVGLGFGLLHISKPADTSVKEPVVEVSQTIEPTQEPEPTPKVELDRSNYSIRVVNATTKAGYAGQIADLLKKQDYKLVDTKNAVEDYEPGLYVLMKEESADLISTLSEDLELELKYLEGIETEDPKGEFGAVVVLAQ